jgi:hypothetical protein
LFVYKPDAVETIHLAVVANSKSPSDVFPPRLRR